MKLIYRIVLRISIALVILLTAWATVFYFIIVDEINDETDDSLEDYTGLIIQRALAGEELPSKDSGTNNSYHIREVTPEYAAVTPHVMYYDEEIYINAKQETEPARVLKTIFRDANERYFELTVLLPTFERSDLKETILLWVILLYVILLLAIIAVNAWILYRSFRPLYTLLGWLDHLTLGGPIPPLNNDTKVTEFRKLNEAMLRNARRNNEMYDEQQQFIGNASHELQTPIAICRNRLEILADDPALTEQQLGEVLKTKQTLEQLSRLNRTLLLLARIGNGHFPESADTDVNDLVRETAGDLAEVYAYRKIRPEIHEEGRMKIRMNDSLASMLFTNLLKNAFVHTPEGGSVTVDISPRTFTVSNSAENGPLDGNRIFRRFYQGVKKPGSTGLGLSLVDSICRLYNLNVEYRFENGRHRFTVTLPPGTAL